MGLFNIDTICINKPCWQQNMLHCSPRYNPLFLTALFFGFFIISIALGVSFLIDANNMLSMHIANHTNHKTTDATLIIDLNRVNREQNIGIYYRLNNFYQNIRSYVADYNITQLSNNNFKAFPVNQNCQRVGESEAIDFPCGNLYKTRVLDTVSLFLATGEQIQLDTDNVIRPSDVKLNVIFGKAFKSMRNWQHTADWMRPAPFASVQKLYGLLPSVNEIINQHNVEIINNTISITLKIEGMHQYSEYREYVMQQAGITGNLDETRNLAIICLFFAAIMVLCSLFYLIIFFIVRKRLTKTQIKLINDYKLENKEIQLFGVKRLRNLLMQAKTRKVVPIENKLTKTQIMKHKLQQQFMSPISIQLNTNKYDITDKQGSNKQKTIRNTAQI